MLIAFVPGGQEQAFEEFAELAPTLGGHVDPGDERALHIVRKYDSEIVGPPL
ncbi:MAG: hypothetical protein ACXV3F_05170 [Frankiaceae bacterium]